MHLDSRIQHEVEDGIEKMGKSLHVRWLPNFHGELGGGSLHCQFELHVQ